MSRESMQAMQDLRERVRQLDWTNIDSLTDVIAARLLIEELGPSDPEAGHSLEDQLHVRILTLAREGILGDISKMADEALKLRDVDFPRWCA